MRVAVSITKEFELEEDISIEELRRRMEFPHKDDPKEIDWYDIEECKEIWSFAIL